VTLDNVTVLGVQMRSAAVFGVFSLEAPMVYARRFSCGRSAGPCLHVTSQTTSLKLGVEDSAFYNNSGGAVRVSGSTSVSALQLQLEVRTTLFLSNLNLYSGIINVETPMRVSAAQPCSQPSVAYDCGLATLGKTHVVCTWPGDYSAFKV
jgi:hypothetical protein